MYTIMKSCWAKVQQNSHIPPYYKPCVDTKEQESPPVGNRQRHTAHGVTSPKGYPDPSQGIPSSYPVLYWLGGTPVLEYPPPRTEIPPWPGLGYPQKDYGTRGWGTPWKRTLDQRHGKEAGTAVSPMLTDRHL